MTGVAASAILATTRFVPVVTARHALLHVVVVGPTMMNVPAAIQDPTSQVPHASTALARVKLAILPLNALLVKINTFSSMDSASPAVPSAPDARGEAAALSAMLPTCSK